jgi:hypothetical protein
MDPINYIINNRNICFTKFDGGYTRLGAFVGPLQLFICVIGLSQNKATNSKGQL